MSGKLQWDASFQIKSVEPVFKDAVSVTSPINLAGTEAEVLQLPDNTIAIQINVSDLSNPATAAACTLEVSKTTSGAAVYESGALKFTNTMGMLEIPLTNITYIRVTNLSDMTNCIVYFMFLVA